jgi:spermidine synthase/MFS family permease
VRVSPANQERPEATGTGRLVLRAGYGVAFFIASAGALVMEITAGRLLAPYVGMSLYSWTAIIAVVLAGLSLGNWCGGYLSERPAKHQTTWIGVAFALAAASSLLSLVLLRQLSGPILGLGMDMVPSVLAISFAAFFLPAFFPGLVGPPLTRRAIALAPGREGRALGQMFALGTLGAIAGTLASGYIFIAWLGSTGTVAAISAIYAIPATVFLVGGRRQNARAGKGGGIGALAFLVALTGAMGLLAARSGALTSPCDRESSYYCIRVFDAGPRTGRPSATLVLDHLGHGVNDQATPDYFWSGYIELTDLVIRARQGERPDFSAYFIGGGAYTLPRGWQARYPEAALTVSEIDPEVTRMAQDRLWLDPAAGLLRILHQDARVALTRRSTGERYDVIIGDAFRDISVPAHLVTREFAQIVRDNLTPQGSYALTVVDEPRRTRFLFSVVRTLFEVFPVVEIWAEVAQLQQAERITYLVVAGETPSPANRIDSRIDLDRSWVRWPADDLKPRVMASDSPVLTDDYAPVDRLLGTVLRETD